MGRVLDGNELAVLGGTPIGIIDRIHPMPRGILPRHQASPAWCAIGGGGIGIHKDHSLLGQLIDVRAFVVLGTHVAKISPAHVVDEEKDDVRLGFNRRKKSGKKEEAKCESHNRTNKKGKTKWSNPIHSIARLVRMTMGLTVLAGRTGFAKLQIDPVPDGQGKTGQGGKYEMQSFPIMNVIMMKGTWSQSQKEQTEKENGGHPKLPMLQVSSEEGRGCNQQGNRENNRLGRLPHKKRSSKQRNQRQEDGHG